MVSKQMMTLCSWRLIRSHRFSGGLSRMNCNALSDSLGLIPRFGVRGHKVLVALWGKVIPATPCFLGENAFARALSLARFM